MHIAEREKLNEVTYSQSEETDAGHGRIEVIKCLQLEIANHWLSDKEKWASIKTVVRMNSERHIREKCTTESRYYIS